VRRKRPTRASTFRRFSVIRLTISDRASSTAVCIRHLLAGRLNRDELPHMAETESDGQAFKRNGPPRNGTGGRWRRKEVRVAVSGVQTHQPAGAVSMAIGNDSHPIHQGEPQVGDRLVVVADVATRIEGAAAPTG